MNNKLLVVGVLGLVACGGDEADGVLLLDGAVQGEYKGNVEDMIYGIAATSGPQSLLGFSNKPVNCASLDQPEPPRGQFGIVYLSTLDVGSYGSVQVMMALNEGSYAAEGSNAGVVTLTASSATSVAGTVAYDHTNTDGETFSLAGTFELERCP